MRILFITHGFPYPPDSGFRMHDYNVIRAVSETHSVLLLSLLESREELVRIEGLGPFCEQIRTVAPQRSTMWGECKRMLRSRARGWPAATAAFMHKEMQAHVRSILAEWAVDIVQIEHSFLAPYIEAIPRGSSVRTILSFHNVGAVQYRRMLRVRKRVRAWFPALVKCLLMLHWEARIAGRFDLCLTVSGKERDLLRTANPSLNVCVVENGVDASALKPIPDEAGGNALLFVGTMGYAPNIDAMLLFSETVLPRVRKAVPDARLIIVGRSPSREIQALAGKDFITVTGAVPDVVPFYERSRVSVAPLRAGGGTRLKILESMALGRPVVSTPLGCEGLDVVHGDQILIARNPVEFADGVIELLTDPRKRDRMARSAREFVERRHNRPVIGRKLLAVYERLTVSRKHPGKGPGRC